MGKKGKTKIEKELDQILSTDDIEMATYNSSSGDEVSLSLSTSETRNQYDEGSDEDDDLLAPGHKVRGARNYDKYKCSFGCFSCYCKKYTPLKMFACCCCFWLVISGLVVLGLSYSPFWCKIIRKVYDPVKLPKSEMANRIYHWEGMSEFSPTFKIHKGNKLQRDIGSPNWDKDLQACQNDLGNLGSVDLNTAKPVLEKHAHLLINGLLECLNGAVREHPDREDLYMVGHTIGLVAGENPHTLYDAFELVARHDLNVAPLHGLLISSLEAAINDDMTDEQLLNGTGWVMNQTCNRLLNLNMARDKRQSKKDRILFQNCVHGVGHGIYRALGDMDDAFDLCEDYTFESKELSEDRQTRWTFTCASGVYMQTDWDDGVASTFDCKTSRYPAACYRWGSQPLSCDFTTTTEERVPACVWGVASGVQGKNGLLEAISFAPGEPANCKINCTEMTDDALTTVCDPHCMSEQAYYACVDAKAYQIATMGASRGQSFDDRYSVLCNDLVDKKWGKKAAAICYDSVKQPEYGFSSWVATLNTPEHKYQNPKSYDEDTGYGS